MALLRMYDDYDFPAYASPGEMALLLVEWLSTPGASSCNEEPTIRRAAYEFLQQAENLISGTLSDPAYLNRHYLYDDFNDRQMHSIQAQQMMSADALIRARQTLNDLT